MQSDTVQYSITVCVWGSPSLYWEDHHLYILASTTAHNIPATLLQSVLDKLQNVNSKHLFTIVIF